MYGVRTQYRRNSNERYHFCCPVFATGHETFEGKFLKRADLRVSDCFINTELNDYGCSLLMWQAL